MGSSLGSEATSINTQSRLLSALLWSLEGQEAVYREQAPVATWGVTGMDTEHFLQRGQTAGVPPLGTVALWTFRRQNKELCNLPLSKVTASTNTAPATPLLPLWFPLLCFVCSSRGRTQSLVPLRLNWATSAVSIFTQWTSTLQILEPHGWEHSCMRAHVCMLPF